MRKKIVILLGVLLLMLSFTAAYAQGHSAGQLEGAGFTCFNAGPFDFTHCLKKFPAAEGGPPTVQVKVFSEDGMEFLGTEILVRPDIYNGQPCPQDGGGDYDLGPEGYRACHRFQLPPLP